MNKVISYKTFEPKQSHSYLIDNSVLLYPFAPIGNYNSSLQESIGKFFQKCRSVGASLSTTSLVIFEFHNKVLKDFFEEFKKNHPETNKTLIKLKEHYRPSAEFQEDIQALNSATKAILSICDRYPDDFHQIDMHLILSNTFNADYNDAYFIELANRKDWYIITRDNDILKNPLRKTDAISFLH